MTRRQKRHDKRYEISNRNEEDLMWGDGVEVGENRKKMLVEN